jgi:hypothetical protein
MNQAMHDQQRYFIQATRAIDFAWIAAAASAMTNGLVITPLETQTRATIEATRCAAYYTAALAYAAKAINIPTVAHFSAIDAGYIADASIQALRQAIDTALDADPAVIDRLNNDYQRLVEIHQQKRLIHEDADFLPNEEDIKATWDGYIDHFETAFDVPDSLKTAAEAVYETLAPLAREGFTAYSESIAHVLAERAAPSYGPPGQCRYCLNTFSEARPESAEKGQCVTCDEGRDSAVRHDIPYTPN